MFSSRTFGEVPDGTSEMSRANTQDRLRLAEYIQNTRLLTATLQAYDQSVGAKLKWTAVAALAVPRMTQSQCAELPR